MSEILYYIITSVVSALLTGGIGSIFYRKLNKKLKESEVKAAEADVNAAQIKNLSSSNEEWIRLYKNENVEKEKLIEAIYNLTTKVESANSSKDEAWEKYSNCRIECSMKDRIISELNWYRCEVNGCPYRKPPRKYGDCDFPKEGINPVENPDSNSL